jgi:hypothetical protein
MDRRKERRLNLELPVRIWGMDRMAQPFAETVRVRDVSNHGAVLIGVRAKVQPEKCWTCNMARPGRSFGLCGSVFREKPA